MLLRHLTVENFLSHEKVELAFPSDGTFLLSGPSGVGKSSLIVDAVAYSLFGAVATRGKKQVELRNNDHPETPMRVETMWEFPDETLVLSRGLDEKNTSWAKAYQPGVGGEESILLAEGAKPVARVIADRLGSMSWQQFYSAFVARQSEITLLTNLKGAQRKDLIHQMLGMRELEKAEQLITKRLRRNRSLTDQIQKSLGGLDLEEEKRRLESLRARTKEVETEIESNKEAHKILSEELEVLQKDSRTKEVLAKSFQRREALASEIALVSKALENTKPLIEKHHSALEAETDDSKIIESIELLEKRRNDLRDSFSRSKEYQDLESRASVLEQEKEEKTARLDPAVLESIRDSDKPAWEAAVIVSTSLEADIKSLGRERSLYIERKESLETKDECYVCRRPFATEHDHQEVLGDLQDSIDSLQETIEEKQEFLNKLKEAQPILEEMKGLNSELSSLLPRSKQLADLGVEEDLDKIRVSGQEVAEELKAKQKELAEIESIQGNINHSVADDYAKQTEELEALQKELDSLKGGSLKDVEAFQDSLDLANKKNHEITEARVTGEQLEKGLETARTDVASQEKILAGREHEFAELDKIRHETIVAEETTKLIRGYQIHLAKEIRPALEEIASEMITQISDGTHTGLFINDEYEISVQKASGAIIPHTLLSGGEEIRANICLRLALTRLVSQRTGVPVNFLVLDEPLPAQDIGHIERILELFESLRPFYRQQFIISHVGDLRSDDTVDYVLDFEIDSDGRRTVKLINA